MAPIEFGSFYDIYTLLNRNMSRRCLHVSHAITKNEQLIHLKTWFMWFQMYALYLKHIFKFSNVPPLRRNGEGRRCNYIIN